MTSKDALSYQRIATSIARKFGCYNIADDISQRVVLYYLEHPESTTSIYYSVINAIKQERKYKLRNVEFDESYHSPKLYEDEWSSLEKEVYYLHVMCSITVKELEEVYGISDAKAILNNIKKQLVVIPPVVTSLPSVVHKQNAKKANRVNKQVRNVNKQKTHCPSGHEYNGENTYVSKKNLRQCKTCLKKRQKDRYATK